MLNIRKFLAELMGVEKISDDDIRKELDELKLDQTVEGLVRDGHLAADPALQSLARKAAAGAASPEEIISLLRSTKPTPAAATVLTPPAGPAAPDTAEAEIQARIAETNEPYHLAATAIAKGATLVSPATGGTD